MCLGWVRNINTCVKEARQQLQTRLCIKATTIFINLVLLKCNVDTKIDEYKSQSL